MTKTVCSLPSLNIDKEVLRRAIGQRIRQRRAALHVTQTALAEACQMDRTVLSKVEAGKVSMSVETVAVLAAVLEVGLNEILGECNPEI